VWELIYYQMPSGRSPIADFLDSLPAREAERVVRKLNLLERLGPNLGYPHVAPLRGQIWELRITGKNQQRVLYVALSGTRIVLLHAFTKKQRKTPAREINTAEHRLKDFSQRDEQ
jgi:phage-related protein